MVLLFLYYIAAPPFVGYVYAMPAEGAYLIVNKVLIELAAMFVLLAFPTS
ncbi:MAG: DoxX subfamily, partial [Desulfuromonadales bacterium]|nr:DoxX subfamily [Desulfuromonadales bacterium]